MNEATHAGFLGLSQKNVYNGFMMGYLMGCDRLLRENKDRWVYKSTLYCDSEYKYDPIPK